MIRRFKALDVERIVNLENNLLGTTLGSEMLLNELNNPLSYIYVYEVTNKVIGYISYVFDGYIAEMLNFCVDKECQGKGIGTEILNYTLNEFKKLNGITSILEVRESNISAINLYKKLGYKEISLRKNYYSNGENAIVLEKVL